MTNPTPITYRAHITIEFTTDSEFPEAIADQLVRRIADPVGFQDPIDSIWLDDVTEPDQGQTP